MPLDNNAYLFTISSMKSNTKIPDSTLLWTHTFLIHIISWSFVKCEIVWFPHYSSFYLPTTKKYAPRKKSTHFSYRLFFFFVESEELIGFETKIEWRDSEIFCMWNWWCLKWMYRSIKIKLYSFRRTWNHFPSFYLALATRKSVCCVSFPSIHSILQYVMGGKTKIAKNRDCFCLFYSSLQNCLVPFTVVVVGIVYIAVNGNSRTIYYYLQWA